MRNGHIKPQVEDKKPPNQWMEEEIDQLIKGLKLYGKDVLKFQEHLPNRSHREIQKKLITYKKSLEKLNKSENEEILEILTK